MQDLVRFPALAQCRQKVAHDRRGQKCDDHAACVDVAHQKVELRRVADEPVQDGMHFSGRGADDIRVERSPLPGQEGVGLQARIDSVLGLVCPELRPDGRNCPSEEVRSALPQTRTHGIA